MVSDEQLLEDLQQFATELGDTPTKEQMNDSGPWSARTYYSRFDGWEKALKSADLRLNKVESKEKLIEDLQEFAEELGETPIQGQMSNSGPWSAHTYINYFGTWNNALREANLEINMKMDTSKQSLIEDLQDFAKELGKTPTNKEMYRLGPRGLSTYTNHFDSWNSALEAAGLEINCLSPEERAGTSERYTGEDYKQKRSKALERDNYICRVCEETENLHCHHITPRREFNNVNDSNTLDNLIILCASCHRTFEGKWKNADPDEFVERAKEYRTETTT